jgi:hypothetical protein
VLWSADSLRAMEAESCALGPTTSLCMRACAESQHTSAMASAAPVGGTPRGQGRAEFLLQGGCGRVTLLRAPLESTPRAAEIAGTSVVVVVA